MHPRKMIACRRGARISVMQPPCMLPILMRHIFGVFNAACAASAQPAMCTLLIPTLMMSPSPYLSLKAALQHCALDKTPGVDKIPYRALCLDIPWWQEAILQFLDLCRSYGCIPSMWKHGIVVPMAKELNASDRDGYRPITLTSCFAKTLEKESF